MTIYNITFSPTGGTKKVADIIANNLGEKVSDVELCVAEKDLKIPSFAEDDVCVISAPSFGGRMPQMAVDRIEKLRGNGAKAVLVCVYGNRAYEDTLTELKATADSVGFKCFAAVAALAEHSIARNIANGRPDGDDEKNLREFAQIIKEKIKKNDFKLHTRIPGNDIYKERGKSKSVPETSEACISCGACADGCPAGAIEFDNPKITDGEKCISCMKCISVCPVGAKGLNKELLDGITERLGKICDKRRENELYI